VRVVHESGDATDDERVVARYWRSLVDANRDRLVVAGDPDLIFPGQQLVLPPVPQPVRR
jgi:nucleoid-associated protein YgaU